MARLADVRGPMKSCQIRENRDHARRSAATSRYATGVSTMSDAASEKIGAVSSSSGRGAAPCQS